MIIEQPARWLRLFYPHATWRMDPNEHSVYLTFDDGPIPEATPFILETLERYDIKATFFMVGDNVRKYPELFERVKAAGHRIGNHTMNHLGSFKHWTTTYVINTYQANEYLHRATELAWYEKNPQIAKQSETMRAIVLMDKGKNDEALTVMKQWEKQFATQL